MLLTGCGRFAFDPVTTGDATTITDAATSTDAPAFNCISDDFATLNLAAWDPYANGPNLQVTGGELVITPMASANGYAGLDSPAPFDFTGGNVSIEVPQVVGQPRVENYLVVSMGATNQDEYLIDYDGGVMRFVRRVAGVDAISMQAYDAIADRFWRIEHIVTTNEVAFSTSPDRATWTEWYRVAATVPVTDLQVEIGAGSYQGGSPSPGRARFDNFQLCLP